MSDHSELKKAALRVVEIESSEGESISDAWEDFESAANPVAVLALITEVEALRNPASKKTDCGHGHVYPTVSGHMAKCGGPGLCALCRRDAVNKAMAMENQRIVPVVRECVKGYGHGGQWCGPDFNCWLDPRSKREKLGHAEGCACSLCLS